MVGKDGSSSFPSDLLKQMSHATLKQALRLFWCETNFRRWPLMIWGGGRGNQIKSRSAASVRLSANAHWLQTDGQTEGRMLPRTLSPCFAVDKNPFIQALAWQVSHDPTPSFYPQVIHGSHLQFLSWVHSCWNLERIISNMLGSSVNSSQVPSVFQTSRSAGSMCYNLHLLGSLT